MSNKPKFGFIRKFFSSNVSPSLCSEADLKQINVQLTSFFLSFSFSFSALETTQAELFDLKTKYDEESTAKYVFRRSTCVCEGLLPSDSSVFCS